MWACTGRVRTKKWESFEGTIRDFDGFDVQEDCEVLYETFHEGPAGDKATQEKVIAIVALRSNQQRQDLTAKYAELYEKDLIEELKSNLGGTFEDAILALFQKADEFDAWCLNDAMSGVGTRENILIEIMCSRTNEEMKAITATYKRLYNKDLVNDIESQTAGTFKKLLSHLTLGSRPVGLGSFFGFLNNRKARSDAQALINVGKSGQKKEQIETLFHTIFATRSFEHLELVLNQYEKLSKQTFEAVAKSKFSGDFVGGILAITKCTRDRIVYFADCLHDAIEGGSTDDKTLIRLMVSRSETDLGNIKSAFESKYSKSLDMFVEADYKKRSGDYKKILLQICGGNYELMN